MLRAGLGVLMVMLALPGGLHAAPGEPPGQLELRLETSLGEVSRQRLEDGTAAIRPAPTPTMAPAVAPGPGPDWYSYTPALLSGAVFLALLAFCLGVLTARRRLQQLRQATTPIQLWNDSDSLETENADLREQLQEQQLLNDSLQSLSESQKEQLESLRHERDQAASESQVLRMRQDDEELASAHELIDQLRAEIEQLQGADTDLDHAPTGDDLEQLRAEVIHHEEHIRELEELMSAVRNDRDSLQNALQEREARQTELEHDISARDTELQQLRERLTGQEQTSDQLTELQQQLQLFRERAQSSQAQLLERQQEIEQLQDQLNLRNEAEEQLGVLQERKEKLETELGARREELILLAEQNDRLQGRLYELEQVMRQDEDLTTQMELGGAAQAAPDQETVRQELNAANLRVEQLQDELQALQQDRQERDELKQQNIKLSAMIIQRDNMVEELQQQLQGGNEPREEWTSTVASLENEVRRKTTLLDTHSDELRQRDDKIAQLHDQLEVLRDKLDAGQDRVEALQAQLSESQSMAAGLREQLEQQQHAATQLELARNPEQDPYGQHVDAIDPAQADIETLRFTVRSRDDLAKSLRAILDEETAALQAARKRARAREDMLVSLENEIAANRITIAALQNRVGQAQDNRSVAGPETRRLERELQRSVKVNEKLRSDLHLWRRRVKPLHEAVVMRDQRIKNLTLEIEALRGAGLNNAGRSATGEYDVTIELGSEQERDHCFREIDRLRKEIGELETRLAETGVELSQVMALEDTHIQEIENLEAARAAQALRIDELHHELTRLGAPAAEAADEDNVVELQVHRPSS